MVDEMFSANIIRKKQTASRAKVQHDKRDVSGEKPRAVLPGAAFFAIPVSLVFTAWVIAELGISLWWALPIYSLIGASVIFLFAVLPRT
jgi:hypothetical protein